MFPNITVHDTVAVRTGGTLAVAFRKNSPQVAKGLNAIIKNYRAWLGVRQHGGKALPAEHAPT